MTSTSAARDLADRLLQAQIDFVVSELQGDRLAEVIAQAVDDVLETASTLVLGDVVDAEAIKQIARRMVGRVGSSAVVDDLVGPVAERLYDLGTSDDFTLGAVVDREPVEALVATLISMHTLQDRALDRLTESPLVAVVASKFVTKIIADFVAQNRARAEKLPGMSSLLSMGSSAANRVRSPFDRQLNQMFGDAAGKSAQFALRQTNSAVREVIRDAPLQDAAMELWDLHADEPIGDLRDYLSRQELRDLAVLVHDLIVSAGDHEWTQAVVDTGIDVFFERWGTRDLADLLTEIGIERDDLVSDLCRLAPPIVSAAAANGVLAGHIRSRLEPFFHSEAVLAMLESQRPRPTKK